MLVSVSAPQTPPRAWENQWNEAHQQYRFDYLDLAAADFAEQARAALPDAEGLLAWYHEQSIFLQRKHYTEQKYSVQVAWIPLDEETAFDGGALLEKYPAPEGTDAESFVTN